jgi:hypothetical protein
MAKNAKKLFSQYGRKRKKAFYKAWLKTQKDSFANFKPTKTISEISSLFANFCINRIPIAIGTE